MARKLSHRYLLFKQITEVGTSPQETELDLLRGQAPGTLQQHTDVPGGSADSLAVIFKFKFKLVKYVVYLVPV